MVMIAHTIITTIMLLLFYRRAKRLLANGAITRVFIELTIPSVLLFLYGIMGINLYFLDQAARHEMTKTTFSNFTVFYGFIIMMIAGVGYFYGVRSVKTPEIRTSNKERVLNKDFQNTVTFLLIIFASLDIYVMFQKIQSGAYFSWMASRAFDLYEIERTPLWLLGESMPPLIASLLVVKIIKSNVWSLILLIYIFLVFLSGERTMLAYTILASFLTYLQFVRYRIETKTVLKYGLPLLVAGALISEIIVDIRQAYRYDVQAALENPTSFMIDVATKHLPNALTNILVEDKNVSGQTVISTVDRLSLWSASFAAQMQNAPKEVFPLPASQFINESLLWVPSVIYPNKPSNTYGLVTNQRLGLSENDPATTIFSSFYWHGGAFGTTVFAFLIGITVSTISRYLIFAWGSLGAIFVFGSVRFLEIQGNSFGTILVGLRDFVLIIFMTFILLKLRKVWSAEVGRIARE